MHRLFLQHCQATFGIAKFSQGIITKKVIGKKILMTYIIIANLKKKLAYFFKGAISSWVTFTE